MICKYCKKNMDELAIRERDRICSIASVHPDELSYETSRWAVAARQAIWWTLAIENDFPLKEATVWTGGHDHTTALYGIRQYGYRVYGFSEKAGTVKLRELWRQRKHRLHVVENENKAEPEAAA
jgi:hypothetical protein